MRTGPFTQCKPFVLLFGMSLLCRTTCSTNLSHLHFALMLLLASDGSSRAAPLIISFPCCPLSLPGGKKAVFLSHNCSFFPCYLKHLAPLHAIMPHVGVILRAVDGPLDTAASTEHATVSMSAGSFCTVTLLSESLSRWKALSEHCGRTVQST